MYSSSYSLLQAVICNSEFYQITNTEVLEKLTRASFNQNAAKTAKQIVVVARKDLWRKEFDQMLLFKITIWRKMPADYY
jgi:hypothetical protein